MKSARKPKTHTIETLLARTQEVGDCMEWQGYIGNGSPQVMHDGKITTVRRLIRILQGAAPGAGVMVGTTCGNHRCVNPDHLIDRDRNAHHKHMASKINFRDPVRCAKIQAAKQKVRKLSDEGVQAARTDPRPAKEIAAEFGVHSSLINRIRRGQGHRQVNASLNPFAGLMR